MQIVIELDDNVFVRLFDNGIDPSKEDREEIEGAIREGIVLPEGHGRLIDGDELLNAIDTWDKFGYTAGGNLIRLNRDNKDMYETYIHFRDSVKCIENMPTIIPADKEEQNV